MTRFVGIFRPVAVVEGGGMVVRSVMIVGVGTCFRVEWRLDMSHDGSETGDHVLDDVIAPDQDAAAIELGWQMTVADVPGDAHKVGRARRRDLGELLAFRAHQNEAAILQLEGIAVA